MTNKTGKGKMNKTNREEKEMKEAAEKYQKQLEASKEIEAVLSKHNFALQPFISYSEFGIVPRVRLVDNTVQEEVVDNETSDDEQATDTPEAGASEDTTESTEPEQS